MLFYFDNTNKSIVIDNNNYPVSKYRMMFSLDDLSLEVYGSEKTVDVWLEIQEI